MVYGPDVRALFMTFGSRGHYVPMEALVRAMLAAGHQVAVASSPAFQASVTTPGVEYLPVGMNAADAAAAFNQRQSRDVAASADAVVAGMFVDICVPAVLEDVQRLLDWKPDVIVREEGEFSAPVVAELAGVPCAEHSWGPVRPRRQRESAVGALTPIWLSYGLAPDPMCGIHRSLYFDICAPSLQFDGVADIRVAWLLQPTTPQFDADVPAWAQTLGDRPVIYVTLGTVPRYNSDSDFFQLAADGLAELDADVVITVGPTGDPACVVAPARTCGSSGSSRSPPSCGTAERSSRTGDPDRFSVRLRPGCRCCACPPPLRASFATPKQCSDRGSAVHSTDKP